MIVNNIYCLVWETLVEDWSVFNVDICALVGVGVNVFVSIHVCVPYMSLCKHGLHVDIVLRSWSAGF